MTWVLTEHFQKVLKRRKVWSLFFAFELYGISVAFEIICYLLEVHKFDRPQVICLGRWMHCSKASRAPPHLTASIDSPNCGLRALSLACVIFY